MGMYENPPYYLSAYALAVKRGFRGTEDEWLKSLQGPEGKPGGDAYQVAVSQGFEGTEAQWLESLRGPEGPQGKPLYVSLDVDVKTGGWSSDRTYDEILNKHKAQQEIICILAQNGGEDLELRLIQATPAALIFGAVVDGVEWQAVISRGSEGEAVVAVSDDSVSTAVRYDCAQELTAEQKAQARENIGAVNADFVNQCIESNKYKTVMVPVESVETLEAYILLQNTGALTPLVSGDKSYVVKKYDVAGISTVAITASACMSAYLYSFCSTSGNVIKLSEKAATGTVLTEIVEQVAQVPENATVLYVSHIVTASNIAAVQRVEQRSIDGSDKWAGKKWVCIGDSLTEANQRTTKRYHDYVAEVTGVTVVNLGISGTGYAKGGANTFYGRIANVPADADIVTIFGSGNDLTAGIDLGEVADTGTETLCGCINTTIDNLIARIPTVQLGIVTPTPWVGQQPGAGKPMEAYANAIVEICKARSIPVLDLYHCSNLRPWTEEGRAACYTKDDGNGVHPDETGHKLIAPRFKSFLESLLM